MRDGLGAAGVASFHTGSPPIAGGLAPGLPDVACSRTTCLVKLGQDLWKPIWRRPVFRLLILLDRDASMLQALSASAGFGRFRASAGQSGWGVVLLWLAASGSWSQLASAQTSTLT